MRRPGAQEGTTITGTTAARTILAALDPRKTVASGCVDEEPTTRRSPLVQCAPSSASAHERPVATTVSSSDPASGPSLCAVKRILYIDMDNTLVDFEARLEGIDPVLRDRYRGREDELPGLFALMPPVTGAIEAFHELAALFDTYILSTAPWHNPSAWQHKVEWVHVHLGIDRGTPAYKRLILSHHKNLNLGDFLVDDRPTKNGADRFGGEVIAYGSESFPDWPAVVSHLRERAREHRA